jgi:hypothetical protein
MTSSTPRDTDIRSRVSSHREWRFLAGGPSLLEGLLLPRNTRALNFSKWDAAMAESGATSGGAMAISAELVQDAETQLLEFLRGRDLSSFSVTIVCGNDKWIISTTDNESGAYCIGQGPTFADAWHDRKNQILTPVRQPLKRAS